MDKSFIFRDFGVSAEECNDILNESIWVCDHITETQQNHVQCGLADQLFIVQTVFNSLFESSNEDEKDAERLELAQRIIDVDHYEARNNDATPGTIAEEIRTDPNTIIKYLLDIIDELQE